MDLDTTSRKGSHERIYRQLVGEIDILLGNPNGGEGLGPAQRHPGGDHRRRFGA